jgi:hypothetical protein
MLGRLPADDNPVIHILRRRHCMLLTAPWLESQGCLA